MTALLIGYAVAIAIVFFASRTFLSIDHDTHPRVSGENTLLQSTRNAFAQTQLGVAQRTPQERPAPFG